MVDLHSIKIAMIALTGIIIMTARLAVTVTVCFLSNVRGISIVNQARPTPTLISWAQM